MGTAALTLTRTERVGDTQRTLTGRDHVLLRAHEISREQRIAQMVRGQEQHEELDKTLKEIARPLNGALQNNRAIRRHETAALLAMVRACRKTLASMELPFSYGDNNGHEGTGLAESDA